MPPDVEVSTAARPLPPKWVTAVQKIATTRTILLAMMILQLLWLVGIWLTGAAAADYKLLPLAIYTLLVGTAVIFLPLNGAKKLQQAVVYLTTHPRYALILYLFVLVVGGSYYASQQRLWPFDEEASYEAALTVAETGSAGLFKNYKNWDWLANQHPPLAPILFGQFLRSFGQSLTTARIVSVFFSMGTGLLTYLIGSELYDRKSGVVSAFFLFTFPLTMRLSSTAMVEPMLTFFFTLTLYLALLLVRRQSCIYLLGIGFVVGVGMLTKYTMVFVLPVLVAVILLLGHKKQILQLLLVLAVTILVISLSWYFLANRIDVFQRQMMTVSQYAGLVLNNSYGRQLLFETMSNRLPSALGLYNMPLLVLGGLWLLLRRSRADWVLLFWLTAVWLPLMLTLPDHRYFMSSFPALAILIAESFQFVPKLLDRSALLAVLYCAGSLSLFIDWSRTAQIFVP